MRIGVGVSVVVVAAAFTSVQGISAAPPVPVAAPAVRTTANKKTPAAVKTTTTTNATNKSSAASSSTTTTSPTFFPKETFTIEIQGMYVDSFSKGENVGTTSLGTNYYFDKRHAVRAEVVGYYLDNDEDRGDDADDALAYGLNVGLRYHFIESGRFTMFFEGLAGMFYGEHNFPAGGTHFNFNEQLGLGMTFEYDEHLYFVGGARYMHISNARIRGEDENPSFDGLGGYVGLLFKY